MDTPSPAVDVETAAVETPDAAALVRDDPVVRRIERTLGKGRAELLVSEGAERVAQVPTRWPGEAERTEARRRLQEALLTAEQGLQDVDQRVHAWPDKVAEPPRQRGGSGVTNREAAARLLSATRARVDRDPSLGRADEDFLNGLRGSLGDAAARGIENRSLQLDERVAETAERSPDWLKTEEARLRKVLEPAGNELRLVSKNRDSWARVHRQTVSDVLALRAADGAARAAQEAESAIPASGTAPEDLLRKRLTELVGKHRLEAVTRLADEEHALSAALQSDQVLGAREKQLAKGLQLPDARGARLIVLGEFKRDSLIEEVRSTRERERDKLREANALGAEDPKRFDLLEKADTLRDTGRKDRDRIASQNQDLATLRADGPDLDAWLQAEKGGKAAAHLLAVQRERRHRGLPAQELGRPELEPVTQAVERPKERSVSNAVEVGVGV